MKKNWRTVIVVSMLLVVVVSVMIFSGCQGAVRSFGGSMTLELPVDTKLENITWKEDSIWYLTRPMTEEDIAETHTFQQSSEYGVFEGKVIIIESKSEEE